MFNRDKIEQLIRRRNRIGNLYWKHIHMFHLLIYSFHLCVDLYFWFINQKKNRCFNFHYSFYYIFTFSFSFCVLRRISLCSPDYFGANSVNQAGSQTLRSTCICFQSAGIKGVCYHLLSTLFSNQSDLIFLQQMYFWNSSVSSRVVNPLASTAIANKCAQVLLL